MIRCVLRWLAGGGTLTTSLRFAEVSLILSLASMCLGLVCEAAHIVAFVINLPVVVGAQSIFGPHPDAPWRDLLVAVCGSVGWALVGCYVAMCVRRWRDFKRSHCMECGYNLTGNVSGVCPECGEPVSSAPQSPP